MRHHLITSFAVAALIATGAAPSTASAASLDEIVRDAQRVRAEAQEVRELLRASRPDMQLIEQRMETLETHAQQLRDSIDAFDSSNLTPEQRAAFDRARVASDALQAILMNKTMILADAERAQRNRSLLRAKADGIAKRASFVETHIARARS